MGKLEHNYDYQGGYLISFQMKCLNVTVAVCLDFGHIIMKK